MAIGILTSGGDAPGLNAVDSRHRVQRHAVHGLEFIGIRHGWKGLVEEEVFRLQRHHIMGIGKQGGPSWGRRAPIRLTTAVPIACAK